MHAFLIVGNNTQDQLNKLIQQWHVSVFDVVRVSGAGIADIREFNKALQISPNGKNKVGILEHMELLTPEAQNAFLKTLEEPPPNTILIGTTQTAEILLPTIVSRMEIIRVKEVMEKIDTRLLNTLLQASVGERMKLIESYVGTSEDAKKFIQSLIYAAHQELITHPTRNTTSLLRNLLIARQQLAVNVSPRLVVDNIF